MDSIDSFRKKFRQKNVPSLANKRKVTVNLVGPCILRDAFGLGNSFGDYTVGTFIQSNSAFTFCSRPLGDVTPVPVLPEDMAKTSPAWYKWARVNMDKSMEQVLGQNPADYVIVGLTEVVDDILKVSAGDGTYALLDCFCAFRKNEVFSLPKFAGVTTQVIHALDFAQDNGGGVHLLTDLPTCSCACTTQSASSL